MNIDLRQPDSTYAVRRYQPGAITVNEQVYQRSIILTPNQLIDDAALPASLAELQPQHLLQLIQLQPSVLLIGTGKQHRFASMELLAPFYRNQIGVEQMSTEAACRTFNLLADDARAVVALLLIE